MCRSLATSKLLNYFVRAPNIAQTSINREGTLENQTSTPIARVCFLGCCTSVRVDRARIASARFLGWQLVHAACESACLCVCVWRFHIFRSISSVCINSDARSHLTHISRCAQGFPEDTRGNARLDEFSGDCWVCFLQWRFQYT